MYSCQCSTKFYLPLLILSPRSLYLLLFATSAQPLSHPLHPQPLTIPLLFPSLHSPALPSPPFLIPFSGSLFLFSISATPSPSHLSIRNLFPSLSSSSLPFPPLPSPLYPFSRVSTLFLHLCHTLSIRNLFPSLSIRNLSPSLSLLICKQLFTILTITVRAHIVLSYDLY